MLIRLVGVNVAGARCQRIRSRVLRYQKGCHFINTLFLIGGDLQRRFDEMIIVWTICRNSFLTNFFANWWSVSKKISILKIDFIEWMLINLILIDLEYFFWAFLIYDLKKMDYFCKMIVVLPKKQKTKKFKFKNRQMVPKSGIVSQLMLSIDMSPVQCEKMKLASSFYGEADYIW